MLDRSLDRTFSLHAELPAIEAQGQTWSWQQVANLRDELDRVLAACGVAENGVVGLISRNRPAQLAALLAIPAARRCASIVSGIQGPARMAEDLRRLRPAALVAGQEDLTAPEVAAAARELNLVTLCLPSGPDQPLDLVSRGSPGAAALLPGVAIQVLTSGTTGAPKRIPLRFDALQQAMEDLEEMLSECGDDGDLTERPPLLLFHPLANISGLYLAFYGGVFGRSMQLFERFSVEEWVAAVRRHRPRLLWLPPAAIAMVVDAGVPPEALSTAVSMRSGAAPLSDTLRDRFEATYGIPILSHYGASEFCGIVAAVTLADYRRFGAAKRGSVGRARPGVSLRIVEEDGRPCPAGHTGLLEVSPARIGDGWIRTTDLAHLDEDGFLYLEGRADDAINRGGFKILPEQVADVLRTHKAVRDVAVVGLPDRRLGQVPAAAVVLREHAGSIDEEELTSFARARLLAYQVPVRILLVAEIPRTGTMKVDRRRVVELFAQLPAEPAD